MGIGSKFIDLWRNYFTVLSTSAFYLILVMVEHTVDPDFKCPEEKYLMILYSLCYIFIPPFGLWLLGLVFQPPCLHCPSQCSDCDCKKCKRCCGICTKAFVPFLLWIIIVLLDGKYFDCLWKPPKANSPAGNSQPASIAYHVSQLVGLGFIGVITLVGCVWLCCRKPTERIPIDAEQSIRLLQDQAAEYLKEQRDEVIQKLIEKHLKDRYAPAPETFLIQLSKNQIPLEIEKGLNVVRGNQPPAAISENSNVGGGSSNGRNSASHSETRTRNAQDSEAAMQPMLDQEASGTSPEGASSPLPQQTSTF